MEVNNPDAAAYEPPLEPIEAPAAIKPPVIVPDGERFRPPQRANKPRRKRKWPFLLIVIVLLALAAAGYWYKLRNSKVAIPRASTTQTAPQPSAVSSSGFIGYTAKGQDLNLSFTYPAGWSISPASGTDTSDQPITVTSPFVSLTAANGQTLTGKVVVLIRPVTSDISELSANSPTEALDSVQFAYTSPTPSQHQYFYESYVHFTNGQNLPGAFEEVFDTGIQQILKATPVQSVGTDPIISASLYQCVSQDCSGKGALPLSITQTTWQNSDITKQAQAILASLQFN